MQEERERGRCGKKQRKMRKRIENKERSKNEDKEREKNNLIK
jgi:hypothetical protein